MSELDDEAKGWFAKAESDLNAARLLAASDGPYDTACFHCQQVVEKYIKGFLVWRRITFPFTHDLGKLAELCVEAEPMLDFCQPEVVDLTAYAARGRYEKVFWPAVDETRAALTVAERVRERIRAIVAEAALP